MEQIFARSTSSNSLISCQNRIMIFSSLISEYWLIWLKVNSTGFRRTNLSTIKVIQLQCDYSNQGPWKKIVQSQRFSIFFFTNGPIKFKINYATVENFKPFEVDRPLRKQTSNLWMLLVLSQKDLRIFCFQKLVWLDNLLSSAPVRVVAL